MSIVTRLPTGGPRPGVGVGVGGGGGGVGVGVGVGPPGMVTAISTNRGVVPPIAMGLIRTPLGSVNVWPINKGASSKFPVEPGVISSSRKPPQFISNPLSPLIGFWRYSIQ
jgi:hypothetical protein